MKLSYKKPPFYWGVSAQFYKKVIKGLVYPVPILKESKFKAKYLIYLRSKNVAKR